MRRSSSLMATMLAALLAWAWATPAQAGLPGTLSRVSLGSGGMQGNAASDENGAPAISAHGRYVVFSSAATNLVPGDTNRRVDLFRRDRLTGQTVRISIGTGGHQANGDSSLPSMSPDGRYVAFISDATNLVPGDTNGEFDVFVRDVSAGTTRRVSVGAGGQQANSRSSNPAISADGQTIAFLSFASNLVPGPAVDEDIFVRDLRRGSTRRVSVAVDGGLRNNDSLGEPAISADARYIAYDSKSSNLVPGDTNGEGDVFVLDRVRGTTRRVSVSSAGAQGDNESSRPVISADGRYIGFMTSAQNLAPNPTAIGVVIRDTVAGTTVQASYAPDGTPSLGIFPSMSADGQVIAFQAIPEHEPVPLDGQIFVRDLRLRQTKKITVTPTGGRANGDSSSPTAISADGQHVGFSSKASNLVPQDTNGVDDDFIWDRPGDTGAGAQIR